MIVRGTKALAIRCLGSRPVAEATSWITRRRLRVLAYHGIDDVASFAHQIEHLARHYVPVEGRQVIAAQHGQRRLPDRAVWVTFDDGHPEVVTDGQPILDRFGITATLFVCPGVVGTQQPFWWEIVEQALELGVRDPSEDGRLVTTMKGLPDRTRRAAVAQLEHEVVSRLGGTPLRDQLTDAQVTGWLEAGHEIGNHTWDHPCLDRCDVDEQVRQILRADHWVADRHPSGPRLFAYPNGNWSATAERALSDHGYAAAVLFDHRLARPGSSPLRISRLRVAADADGQRFRAIVSGAHPFALRLADRVRRRGRARPGAAA